MVDPASYPNDEFIQLLVSHQAQLRGLIMAGLGRHADAQDVLQKTNLALWKKAAEFDRSRSFLAWAIGVARFEILAWIRDRQRDRHVFNSEVAEVLVAVAQEQLEETPPQQIALRACLQDLPQPQRELLQLKYVRNRSIEEISAAIGRSRDGVKSLLLRVRKGLAACIERRLASAPEPT